MAIPLDVREFVSAEKLTEPDPAYSNWRAVFMVVAYGGIVSLAFWVGSPYFWALSVVVCSILSLNNQAAIHEAVHSNMYRSGWANDLAGLIWSAPILAPFATYRAAHLDHHRFAHTKGDTEPIDAITSLGFYVAVFPMIALAYTFKLYTDQWATVFGHPPTYVRTARQRRLIVINAVVQVLAVAVIVVWGIIDWHSMLLVWGLPFVVSTTVVYATVVLPEHYGCEYGPGSPFQTTRTTTSNPVVRFLYWGSNFHTGHHLVPSVPSQKLHRLQPLIAERVDHVTSGYLPYHWSVIRDLRSGRIVAAFETEDALVVDLRETDVYFEGVDRSGLEIGAHA